MAVRGLPPGADTPTVAPPLPPITEKGRVSSGNAGWWLTTLDDETAPELRWPLSVQVFDKMRRTDAQIASVLRAVTLPVQRTGWRVDPNGAREEVAMQIAEDLGLPLMGETGDIQPAGRTKDRFSWSEHLELALLMLPFGAMFFEQVLRVDEAGRLRLRKLGPRMPKTLAGVNVARDGGLVSIEQDGDEGGRVVIPVDRLVAYVHKREGGNWLGSSILRPCYKFWILKDRLLRTQAQTIDRNGMGIPVYEAAEGEESLAAGLAIAQSVRSGDNSGAATPPGAKLRLMGVEGELPDASPVIRYYDEQIARAVLAHFLNLGTQTGSWALGSTFADFFTLSLQAIADQIADVATQHIVEDLVDWNWGPDEPSPRIVHDEIGSKNETLVTAIKMLVDSGVIIPDRITEEFTRQLLGLPAKALPSPTPPPEVIPAENRLGLADRRLGPDTSPLVDAVAALVAREAAPPNVHVDAHIHMPPPADPADVHVDVHVPAPAAQAAPDVHVDVHVPPLPTAPAPSARAVVKTIERDANGDIVRIIEET